MAIRFVIGRAGTGKTSHCLASVRRHLRESPVDGERLILLVPEQASLQTERALIDHPDVGATVRAQVLSFRRLALRVLQETGARRRQALSDTGRTMVLRHLLGELGDRLRLYRNADRYPGLIGQLARTIVELIDEAVAPTDLDPPAAADADDPLLRHKIDDVRLVYAAYMEYLATDKLDASQQLELAREQVPRCETLTGARLWVDGFAGFTGQQVLMLVALARVARSIEITAMIDPDYAMRAGDAARVEPTDLFGKVQRTFLDLRQAFAEAAIAVEPPLGLSPDPPPRFAGTPALARVERLLFSERQASASGADLGPVFEPVNDTCGTGQHVSRSSEPGFGHSDASCPVTLVRASDRRAEADYVASLICQLIQDGAGRLRYRDVAVILRDLDPYHDLLSAALSERAIPFFIDRRRPTSHHPVVELLRGLTGLVDRPFSLEAVRLLLKTGLTGLDDTDADELENYVLACGIEGAAVWRQEGDWTLPSSSPLDRRGREVSCQEQRRLARIDRSRRRFIERFRAWYDAAQGHRRTGREWAHLMKTALDDLHVADRLAEWACRAEDDGDLDLAEQHRQIARDITAFLDDLCVALGDERMDVQRLGEVLNAGLSQLTLGLAPPMLDQVLVGSVERSRHPDIRVAIIMGFNEGLFPHSGAEGSIFNDDDRDWLTRQGVRIGITRRQRVLDESLLAYTALTRASDAVWVTFAAADEDGKALRESPYVAALARACPELESHRVDDGYRSRDTWNIRVSRDLAARLAHEFRNRPPLAADDDRRRRGLWNDLYEASRQAEGLHGVLQRSLASLTYTNVSKITEASASRLVSEPFTASVSRLETFAACPFQHFARYGLGLEERKLAALADVDVGTIHHAILERFVRQVVQSQGSLAEMDDAQMRSLLDASCDAVTDSVASPGVGFNARDQYMLKRSAADLDRMLHVQRRAARAGRFRPRAAEVPFGFDTDESLPPLAIKTPAGRTVLLRGFIDRVDLAELADEMLGVVIDYKRTRDKRLDLSAVYHGLSLQLVAYLLVLAGRGESLGGRPVQPVGAFYVTLIDTYEKVGHPSDARPAQDAAVRAFGPRGLLNADRIEPLDTAFASTGRSAVYRVGRTKDGRLGWVDTSDGADGDQFDSVLAHVRRRLGELADRIAEGDVTVSPYRLGGFSPCSWCRFSAACRFEFGTSSVRYLEKLKRSEVFRRIVDPTSA
ncbi:MAG: PD-(D/E)XK nuclease family protein [Phycisphaerales bacterium]|nr:MAG: PD-(D/E)XK nuclease family protein [Phycisphaerales bacterium]